MKQLLTLTAVLFAFFVNAQKYIYTSENVSGTGTANNGIEYNYEAKVSARSYLPGMNDIRYQLSVTNYKITSIAYNGKYYDASKYGFPIEIPRIQTDVYFTLKYSRYHQRFKTAETSETKMLAVQQGYGDYADLSKEDVEWVRAKCDVNSKEEFLELSLILENINLKNTYFEELARVKREIEKEIEKEKKNEQIEDSNKSKNKQNNEAKNKNNKEKDKKIKQQEKEKLEATRVTQQNWQYYENYKSKLEELRRKGQTNTDEYRETLKALKITESALPINHYDKYSTKIEFQEGATKAVNTFKSAIEDGTITGLSLGISSRQMTDEEKHIRSLSYFNYNLGFHLFGKSKLIFGLGFPDSTDNGKGFSGSITMDFNLFGLKLMEDDNFDFIKFGLIVEGGGGTYNEGELRDEIDETSYFVGGGLRVTLVKFLYGTFAYGYATGEELGNEGSKTDGMYSQIGFGLSINF